MTRRGIIIEARVSSTRLPGKVLKEFINKPSIIHQIERLKNIDGVNEIIVATTKNQADDKLVKLLNTYDVKFYRGSEKNVMQRVIQAAEKYNIDHIIEITGDCPLIDPEIVEQHLKTFLSNNVDYLSNNLIPSYPDGMDIQIFSLNVLKHSYSFVKSTLEKEHVTIHIKNNPKIYRHLNLIAPKKIRYPELGLTLDEKDDYKLIKKIFEKLYPKNQLFSCYEIIEFLFKNKNLLNINKNVKRKGYT